MLRAHFLGMSSITNRIGHLRPIFNFDFIKMNETVLKKFKTNFGGGGFWPKWGVQNNFLCLHVDDQSTCLVWILLK